MKKKKVVFSRVLISSILIGFIACSEVGNIKISEKDTARVVILDTIRIPTTGRTVLLSHSQSEKEVLALNLSRSTALFYNYELKELVNEFEFKNNPDTDPGIFYSAGYYKQGFYMLGSNGVFIFDENGELLKSLKNKFAQYSEPGPVKSYIINKDGEDFLICKLKSPQETLQTNAKPGTKEYLEELKFITVIPLDKEEFSYYLIGAYSEESNALNNDGKIPRRGILFASDHNSIQIVFSSEPKAWAHTFVKEETSPTKSYLLNLDFEENRYLLPFDQFQNQHDFLRATIMNPSYGKFIFDARTDNYYFSYYKAFDRSLEDEIIREGSDWMINNGENYNRQRLAAYDQSFAKIFEVPIDKPIGSLQLVFDNKFFHTIIGYEDETNESFLIIKVVQN